MHISHHAGRRRHVRFHWLFLSLLLVGARLFAQQGTLRIDSVDLGDKYVKTGTVAYFDLLNTGTVNVHVDSVYVTQGDSDKFTVKFPKGGVNVRPDRFYPVRVDLDLIDTSDYSTTVTVLSNASNPVISATLHARGRDAAIRTTMQDFQAHAFEFFSVPIIVDSVYDPIGTSHIQRWSCELKYDPTLLTFDTAALSVGRDTQGVSSGFLFTFGQPYRPSDVIIHASGSGNGIHRVGDTICKLTFQANQFLFTAQTPITTTFSGDSGFLYVRFTSDTATFVTLPCLYPTKVIESVTARLLDNHPNPFNPTTRVRYQVDETGFVTIRVYDRIGRVVHTLVNGMVEKGVHEVDFNGGDAASGTYFCRLYTPLSTDVRIMMLSR